MGVKNTEFDAKYRTVRKSTLITAIKKLETKN